MKTKLALIVAVLSLAAGCLSTGPSAASSAPTLYQGAGSLKVSGKVVGQAEMALADSTFTLTFNLTESATTSVIDTQAEGMARKDHTFNPFTATFTGTVQKVEDTTFLQSEPNEAGLVATCFPTRSGGYQIDVRTAEELNGLKESLKKEYFDFFTLYTFAEDAVFQGEFSR